MKLVIFDCDGTLVDSAGEISANMQTVFDAHGVDWPGAEATRQCVGLSLIEFMRRLHPDGTPETHQALAQDYRDLFQKNADQDKRPQVFFDGALEVIQRLRQRDEVLLALATGKSQRGVTRFLENAGLSRNMFVSIQTADDAPSKPNPAMVLQAMAEAGGIGGHDTVMVGDASYDMEMARAAGVFAIGVEWGYHDVDILLGSGAQEILNHFNDLDAMLEGLWEE